MREADPHEELEKALLRLMPAALSESAKAGMEARIDELAVGSEAVHRVSPRRAKWKWLGGIAAAAAIVFFAFVPFGGKNEPLAVTAANGGVVVLAELDRVENVSDEGLFVDAGGSALRKMSVRVIGESRIIDGETGIEVTLTEPRKEMYLLPVSNF